MNQGRCLCGTVRFEGTAPVAALAHGHCSMCRKHHGTAFVTWAVVPAAALRITAGTDNIRRYASSAAGHRAFCATCGSVVPEIAPGGAYAVIPAGNIEGDLGLEPQFHMFVGSKAARYQITDDLPQHAEFPPAFARPAEPRPAVPVRAGT